MQEVTEWRNKQYDIEKKFEALQEFIANNVVVALPSMVERSSTETVPHLNNPPASREDALPASQFNSPPASQANPQPASQPNPQPDSQANSQPASQANSQPTSQANSQPALQANSQPSLLANSQTAPHYASLPASQDDGFQTVRNGTKPKQAMKHFLTPTTFSRFQVLTDTMEDEFESHLVGDSMVRVQLDEFCGRSSNGRRKLFCYPEARPDDITAACDDVTSNADRNTLFVIHWGTHDIKTTLSEEKLEKYRRMIKQYKRKMDAC